MDSVLLSPNVRSTVNALSSIQAQIDAAQTRLATGKRVNGPIDDPGAYFAAQALTSRADSISALTDSLQTARSTIAAAGNGIKSIQSLLSTAQNLAYQALQASGTTPPVVAGTRGSLTTGTLIASTGGTSTKFKAGDTVTVSDGTTTATYTAANNDTVQTFINAVNGTSGLKVVASLNASGQVQLTATSTVTVTIGGSVNGAGGGSLSNILGLTAGSTAPAANTALRQNLAAQFDAIRAQIDEAAADAGLSGVNLLMSGSLNLTLNETGSSTLAVSGADVTSSGVGLTASGNDWASDSDINASLAQVNSAIASVAASSASLNASDTILQARLDFNKSMSDTLSGGASQLTAADANADSVLLLALQTRQQLAATSLSLAHGAYASALQLLS
jgi:flagellin-like hook-associated protein FlgL